MIEQMDFHIIQVHGKLSDEVLGEIKLPVWRAYNIQDEMNPEEVSNPKICGYVLDGAKPGSGEAFDWEALGNFQREIKR